MGRDERHLLLVERNEVRRLGRAIVARKALGAGWSVKSLDIDQWREMHRPEDLIGVDVVLIVIEADGQGFDRYDAVEVVGQATSVGEAGPDPAGASGHPLVVAAVSNPYNPLLDIRIASAGAHRQVHMDDVSRSGDGRLALAVNPDSVHEVLRSAADLGTYPDAVLDHVRQLGIEHAFTPALTQGETGLSRRALMKTRREIARIGGIRTSLDRYTGGNDRRVDLPTWREVVGYVNCARGATDWSDDAWGNGSGPRIGLSRYGVWDLEAAARGSVA